MANDVSDRLTKARERAGRSIRSLQKELEKQKVPGSSYANVYAYMSGKTTPSLDFLAATAEALNVRVAWLAFDEGPMTDTDAVTEPATRRATEVEAEIEDALVAAFPAIERISKGSGAVPVWNAWSHVYDATAMRDERGGDLVKTATKVGRAMQAPLDALGIEAGDLSLWQLEAYTALIGQAIQVATAHPKMLRPMSEVLGDA